MILALLVACAPKLPRGIAAPPTSTMVVGEDPSRSTIYLARVDGGIIVIDLGWWGAAAALERGLTQLGATADDVVAVFLTHSHRDHIGAWRTVRDAPFHVAAAEVDLLFRQAEHGGWIPRLAERLRKSDLPAPGDVEVRAFAADTFFAFGADTLRAFVTPGHTAGSAAYLFRGTLFAGDLIAHTWLDGFRPARGGYSDDPAVARRSLESLRRRLEPYDVQRMCSAHLKCSVVTPALWQDLLEDH